MGQEGWGHPWVGSVGCGAEIGEIVLRFPWALEEPRPYEPVDTGGSSQKLPPTPSDEGSICRATEDVGLFFFLGGRIPVCIAVGLPNLLGEATGLSPLVGTEKFRISPCWSPWVPTCATML